MERRGGSSDVPCDETAPQVNIPDELAKITSFEGYAHTSEELPATIQRALKLLQYSVAAHVVAAVAKGFGLVPDDDPDIRYIELESQRRPNRLLREAPKEYEKLEQLFRCPEGSLRDIHFSLIAKFRDCRSPSVLAHFSTSRLADVT